MLVLIEGMDNTGKTTLAKNLLNELPGFSYLHNVKPESQLEAFQNVVALMSRGSKENIICDRVCIIGENIYGKVLRGNSYFTEDETRIIMKMLSSITAMSIFCNPPLITVLSSINQRDQMEGVELNAKRLYEEYLTFFHKYWKSCGVDYRIWDFTSSIKDTYFKEIVLDIHSSKLIYEYSKNYSIPVSFKQTINDHI